MAQRVERKIRLRRFAALAPTAETKAADANRRNERNSALRPPVRHQAAPAGHAVDALEGFQQAVREAEVADGACDLAVFDQERAVAGEAGHDRAPRFEHAV